MWRRVYNKDFSQSLFLGFLGFICLSDFNTFSAELRLKSLVRVELSFKHIFLLLRISSRFPTLHILEEPIEIALAAWELLCHEGRF